MREATMSMQAKSRAAYARRALLAGAAFTAVLLSTCATTKLEDQWRDPEYRATAGQRLLVIAVTGRDDRRRVFEDDFVTRLREEGVDAVPSYRQLSVIGPENLDAVKAVVEKNNATMVLSVRLAQVDEQTSVSQTGDGAGYYSRVGFYGYYPHATASVSNSPTSSTTTYKTQTYMTETRVFDMKSDKLVWAALLKSEEPKDFGSAAAQYTDLVVDQMRDSKILGGK